MHRHRRTTAVPVFLFLMLLALAVPRVGAQPSWPNLDVLQNYPKPGISCSLRGAAPQGSEKAKSNALKNRYRLPTTGFEQVLLSDIIGLPLPLISSIANSRIHSSRWASLAATSG